MIPQVPCHLASFSENIIFLQFFLISGNSHFFFLVYFYIVLCIYYLKFWGFPPCVSWCASTDVLFRNNSDIDAILHLSYVLWVILKGIFSRTKILTLFIFFCHLGISVCYMISSRWEQTSALIGIVDFLVFGLSCAITLAEVRFGERYHMSPDSGILFPSVGTLNSASCTILFLHHKHPKDAPFCQISHLIPVIGPLQDCHPLVFCTVKGQTQSCQFPNHQSYSQPGLRHLISLSTYCFCE